MPINPNIALGVQPIQQTNMLGQMGQMLALKAAQQESEGYEGVKSAISGGMDAADPRMLQYGKRGIEAFKAAGEGRVKQQDFLTKSYANARETLNNVRTPEELLAFSVGQFNDPAIGPALKARGLTPESVAANLQKELSTSGFNTVLKKSAMGLDGFFKDETSRRNQDVASGASYGQLDLAKQRFAMEKEENENIARLFQNRLFPQTATSATSVDKPNVLATQVGADTAPAQSVNALSGGSVQQRIAVIDSLINDLMGAGAKAMPRVQALIAQKNAILNEYSGDSKELLGTNPETGKPEPYLARLNKVTGQYEPVPVNQPTLSVSAGGTNTSTSASPTAATSSFNVAKPKLTPQAEKQLQVEEDRVKGKADVAEVIGNLASKYQNLASTGGMTSTKKGVMENIGSYLANTIAGQEIGKMTATQQQSLRNEIKSASPILLQSIKKATGMTAKEMDSNADVKRWMEAMSTTSFDVESALGILRSLNAQFGSGNEIPAAPAAPAATNKPSGGFKYIGPVKE
jgi:hypothetical protein